MTRRFGIEFEFVHRRYGDSEYSDYDFYGLATVIEQALQQFSNPPAVRTYDDSDWDDDDEATAWIVKDDPSCGFEVTTPASTWRSWPQIRAVLQALLRSGARTNRSCGMHVHHEALHLDAAGLRRLWYLWYVFEPTLYAALAPSRLHNSYCRRFRDWRSIRAEQLWNESPIRLDDPQAVLSMNDRTFSRLVNFNGRYQGLNLTNWWQHGRVEVRAHHGTLRSSDVEFWVRLTQRFIDVPSQLSNTDLVQLQLEPVREQLHVLADLLHRDTDRRWNWHNRIERMITRRNSARLVAA